MLKDMGMTAKEYLRQLKYRDAKITAMLERRAHYRDLATRASSVYRDMPGGVSRVSSVEEYVSKIVDLDREIDTRIDEYVDLTREIENMIDSIRDDRYRNILRWRYVNGWGWEKIAQAMYYDVAWAWRLHGRALLEIDKIRKKSEITNAIIT